MTAAEFQSGDETAPVDPAGFGSRKLPPSDTPERGNGIPDY